MRDGDGAGPGAEEEGEAEVEFEVVGVEREEFEAVEPGGDALEGALPSVPAPARPSRRAARWGGKRAERLAAVWMGRLPGPDAGPDRVEFDCDCDGDGADDLSSGCSIGD